VLDWTPAEWIELAKGVKALGLTTIGVITATLFWYIWCRYGRKPKG